MYPKIDCTDVDYLNPQKWSWIEMQFNGSIPIGNNERYRIPLLIGDVFGISWGEFQDLDRMIKTSLWVLINGKVFKLNEGSLNSSDMLDQFFQLDKSVFKDVTIQYLRNLKLEKLCI